jgi:hypothetical protein
MISGGGFGSFLPLPSPIFRLERGSSRRLLIPSKRPPPLGHSWIAEMGTPGSTHRRLLFPDQQFGTAVELHGENGGHGIDVNYGIGLRSSHFSCGIEVFRPTAQIELFVSFRIPSSFLHALLPLMRRCHDFVRLLDPLPAMDLAGAASFSTSLCLAASCVLARVQSRFAPRLGVRCGARREPQVLHSEDGAAERIDDGNGRLQFLSFYDGTEDRVRPHRQDPSRSSRSTTAQFSCYLSSSRHSAVLKL